MNSRILPFFLLALSLVIFFVYIEPLYTGSIASKQASIKTDDQAIAGAAAYIAKEQELAQARDSLDSSALARLSALAPDSVDNAQLYLDIATLAQHSGLILSSIGGGSADQAAPADDVEGLPGDAPLRKSADFTIAASGTYSSFRTFLTGLEKSLRLIDVRSLSVSGTDNGVYNYSLTVRTYFIP